MSPEGVVLLGEERYVPIRARLLDYPRGAPSLDGREPPTPNRPKFERRVIGFLDGRPARALRAPLE